MSQQQANGVGVDLVYQSLVASLHPDPNIRDNAEKTITGWEKESAPGFLAALLEIASNGREVPEVCTSLKWYRRRFMLLIAVRFCRM